MKILLPIILLWSINIFGNTNNVQQFSIITNSGGIPLPPKILELPSLEVVSSIITASNSLQDIEQEFDQEAYTNTAAYYPPEEFQGVWWRFYTQTTSLYNILAVSEEILSIKQSGDSLWLQDIKTAKTIRSSSRRKLVVSYFDLFNHQFLVFHYSDQDPTSQAVKDRQGFFVRVLSDKSYMQMSTSPNFEPDKSIYWRRFPQANVVQLAEIDKSMN